MRSLMVPVSFSSSLLPSLGLSSVALEASGRSGFLADWSEGAGASGCWVKELRLRGTASAKDERSRSRKLLKQEPLQFVLAIRAWDSWLATTRVLPQSTRRFRAQDERYISLRWVTGCYSGFPATPIRFSARASASSVRG